MRYLLLSLIIIISSSLQSQTIEDLELKLRDLSLSNNKITEEELMLMYDAQTSGGLLIAVSPEKTAPLINKLDKAGISWCKNIGKVTQRKYKPIEVI